MFLINMIICGCAQSGNSHRMKNIQPMNVVKSQSVAGLTAVERSTQHAESSLSSRWCLYEGTAKVCDLVIGRLEICSLIIIITIDSIFRTLFALWAGLVTLTLASASNSDFGNHDNLP